MKKTTKNIIGLAGLLAVGLMTAFAISIEPASALDPGDGTTTTYERHDSADVEVKVVVVDDEVTSGYIEYPFSGATTAGKIKVQTVYGHTSRIEYLLAYEDEEPILIDSRDFHEYRDTGEEWTLDVASYGKGYGKYTLIARFHGTIDVEDMVQFTYKSNSIDDGKYDKDGVTTDDDGKITLNIDTDPQITDIVIELQDLDGNPVIGLDGNPVVIRTTPDQTHPIVIDLASFGIPQGEYRLKVTGYDANGRQVGDPTYIYLHFHAANVPLVPNTGGSLFAGLNLSRTDYLTSGIIIFVLTALGGAFFLRRSHRR